MDLTSCLPIHTETQQHREANRPSGAPEQAGSSTFSVQGSTCERSRGKEQHGSAVTLFDGLLKVKYGHAGAENDVMLSQEHAHISRPGTLTFCLTGVFSSSFVC